MVYGIEISIELIQEDFLYGDFPNLAELLYASEVDPAARDILERFN